MASIWTWYPTDDRHTSCPFGLGGYSNEGFAWRFEISPDLWFRALNNLLKFMASVISPWMDIIAERYLRETVHRSKNTHQNSTPSRIALRREGYKGILTVVWGEEESGSRCPLSRIRETRYRTNQHFTLTFSIAASTAFRNSTAANRNCLDLIAAEIAREGAVTGVTHKSQARSWRRFKQYVDLERMSFSTHLQDRFRRGYAAGKIFRTVLWKTGWGNNPKFPLGYMLDLQEEWKTQSNQGRRHAA